MPGDLSYSGTIMVIVHLNELVRREIAGVGNIDEAQKALGAMQLAFWPSRIGSVNGSHHR